MIQIAPYAEDVSKEAGATPEQFKAGVRLVELAMAGEENISIEVIQSTEHPIFRRWIRVKGPKASYRVIVENTGTEIIIHAVLPRDNDTYDVVMELWGQYRSPK